MFENKMYVSRIDFVELYHLQSAWNMQNDTNCKMFGSMVNLIYSLDLQFTITIKFQTMDKPSGLDPVQSS